MSHKFDLVDLEAFAAVAELSSFRAAAEAAVSYTHLTLPTNREV